MSNVSKSSSLSRSSKAWGAPDGDGLACADAAATRPGPDPDALALPTGDPLGELLHLLNLTGAFYCQSRFSAPWGVEVPPLKGLMSFVVVGGGRCSLLTPDNAPLPLKAGDLALLTGGAAHSLRSDPDAPAAPLEALPTRRITEIFETLDYGGGGAVTRLTYGVVRLDHAAAGMLLDLLPDVVKIDNWSDEDQGWLQATLRHITREARALRPGGEAVIRRLADVVVIEAIRRWIETAPEAERGWLGGARDHRIGRAIIAIHRAPASDWTLATLARIAGMSRSAFAARFTSVVGLPAMRYLALWRLQIARTQILSSSAPLSAIAAGVGYVSEPAFCRAYKRAFGEPPGATRRRGAPRL